jgi:hypothetical protein
MRGLLLRLLFWHAHIDIGLDLNAPFMRAEEEPGEITLVPIN